MPELIAHGFGDYVLQSQSMADRKVSDIRWALLHAFVYGLPFLVLVPSLSAWLVIVLTHALIDRYSLAKKWCDFYGTGTRAHGLWARWNVSTDPVPPLLVTGLTIIVDNTFHLLINHLALAM